MALGARTRDSGSNIALVLLALTIITAKRATSQPVAPADQQDSLVTSDGLNMFVPITTLRTPWQGTPFQTFPSSRMWHSATVMDVVSFDGSCAARIRVSP